MSLPPSPVDRKRVDEMGGKKTAGIVLLLVGIVVLFLSLLADFIGLWGGAVMTVVGLVLILKKSSADPHPNLDRRDTWRGEG
jgi:membrane-bound ClpP family serine protease